MMAFDTLHATYEERNEHDDTDEAPAPSSDAKPKNATKAAAGRMGGKTRAANAAAKQLETVEQAAPQAPIKQPEPVPEPAVDERPDDWRTSKAEVSRVEATPEIARSMQTLLADPWVARLTPREFRIYAQLLADADEHGRVIHDDRHIVLRALWSDVPEFEDGRAGDHRGGCPWEHVWPEVRDRLVNYGLIECGTGFVYVVGIAPPPAHRGARA